MKTSKPVRRVKRENQATAVQKLVYSIKYYTGREIIVIT